MLRSIPMLKSSTVEVPGELFEKIVFRTYPEISKIKKHLIDTGAVYASLSGSGSTMFGFFNNMRDLIKSRNLLKSYQSVITSPAIQ